jgi:hypothetical protein
MDLKPRARKEDIVVQSLADELLVYDLKRHKAFCLNETSALIWKHCDGNTDVTSLRNILESELKTPIDDEVVFLGLDQLSSHRLLLKESIAAQGKMSPSRRAALKKVGAAALISLPAIIAIVAPTAASAQTGLITPAQCNSTTAGLCCNNNNTRRLCQMDGASVNFTCNGPAC